VTKRTGQESSSKKCDDSLWLILRWRDAQRECGPHKTLYNRFIRCALMALAERGSPAWHPPLEEGPIIKTAFDDGVRGARRVAILDEFRTPFLRHA
jgi:hypothetical protein